jgi:hypothetical protein
MDLLDPFENFDKAVELIIVKDEDLEHSHVQNNIKYGFQIFRNLVFAGILLVFAVALVTPIRNFMLEWHRPLFQTEPALFRLFFWALGWIAVIIMYATVLLAIVRVGLLIKRYVGVDQVLKIWELAEVAYLLMRFWDKNDYTPLAAQAWKTILDF